jgi:hypothetical protein
MLCKTSFDVVNKAANDSIAITWTVTIQWLFNVHKILCKAFNNLPHMG